MNQCRESAQKQGTESVLECQTVLVTVLGLNWKTNPPALPKPWESFISSSAFILQKIIYLWMGQRR